jgi:hypothetical protein
MLTPLVLTDPNISTLKHEKLLGPNKECTAVSYSCLTPSCLATTARCERYFLCV